MEETAHKVLIFVIGVIAIYTGEIVSFVMLGFILISLTNINNNLKKMNTRLEKGDKGDELV